MGEIKRKYYKHICDKCGKSFESPWARSCICDGCFDLTGKRFGLWKVSDRAPDRKSKDGKARDYWNCRCECGTEKQVYGYTLRAGKSTNCGCVSKKMLIDRHAQKDPNLANRVFGELTAIEAYGKDRHGKKLWRCICSCGKEVLVDTRHLISGGTKSCGHAKIEMVESIAHCGTNPSAIASPKLSKNNTSGIKGVWFDKNRCKWTAEIMFQKIRYHLGRYQDKKDAIEARLEAERRIHGGFLEWYKENYPDKWEKIEKNIKHKEKTL